ncbi:GreA/GreB family elongation factor [Adhaeribacter radiodurans]|uniref:GreA/GreB family elongation factor n=1 Tax=Adhaeribacter radiodurans TaxID=2745197 RepID=A0A7L7LA08_9BACT|nr:GreA/GreB family elongation factor [Adhaeribacter radiodurans]QMU29671.1 GreA/GreB family elongation factor [Adhaeribacter radiodurans]
MDSIYLTEEDYRQLIKLTQVKKHQQDFSPSINRLKQELKRALVQPVETIPPEIVTMNSRVRVIELKSSSEMTITIVYPEQADFNAGKISILSPLGTAILGRREGDEVIWTAPYCKFIYRIEEVLYQPEAAGLLT